MKLTNNQVMAEQYRRSFYRFVKAAWFHVEGAEYVDSKYIEVICSHMQWVYSTGNSIVINIPPRHGKSILVSVMFNAWVWTFSKEKTFLCATHNKDLTLRDSQRCRELIKSSWYIELFGDVGFSPDQDVKGRFLNASKGGRQSIAVRTNVTGDGADFRIIDDPVDASDSFNNAVLDFVNTTWFGQTLSSRVKNPSYCPQILVMQRLAPNDLSGHLIAKGWFVLCLPLEFDANHPIPSNTPPEAWPKGMTGDWREEKGELLCPERFSSKIVKDWKISQGVGAAGQLNQYPQSPEGDIITDAIIGSYVNVDCGGFERLVIKADTAEKTGANNAYSVFTLFGKKHGSKDLYVLDSVRVKQEITDLVITARAFFNKHITARYNDNPIFSDFGIEDKSSGTQLLQILQRSGLGVSPIKRKTKKKDGDSYQETKKWQRLEQVANYLKLHNSKILFPSEPTVYTDAAWVDDFIAELKAKQVDKDGLGFWDQADVLSDGGFDLLVDGRNIDASALAFM